MTTLALLNSLAGPDLIIIFLIVLIMFGAKKLPELAKGLGQAVREFGKAKDDMSNELNRAAQIPDPSHYHPPVDPATLPHAGVPQPTPPAYAPTYPSADAHHVAAHPAAVVPPATAPSPEVHAPAATSAAPAHPPQAAHQATPQAHS